MRGKDLQVRWFGILLNKGLVWLQQACRERSAGTPSTPQHRLRNITDARLDGINLGPAGRSIARIPGDPASDPELVMDYERSHRVLDRLTYVSDCRTWLDLMIMMCDSNESRRLRSQNIWSDFACCNSGHFVDVRVETIGMMRFLPLALSERMPISNVMQGLTAQW